MKPQVTRVAAYGLIMVTDPEPAMFLCRLCPPERLAGWWTLPGGGLDFGESPEDALTREVHEETGLEARSAELLRVNSEVFHFEDRDMHAVRLFYAVHAWSGEIKHELNGSTDQCALIPLRALDPEYRHPEYGQIQMVEIAEEAMRMSVARQQGID